MANKIVSCFKLASGGKSACLSKVELHEKVHRDRALLFVTILFYWVVNLFRSRLKKYLSLLEIIVGLGTYKHTAFYNIF